MRKALVIISVFISALVYSQIFSGKGDQKFHLGADFQTGATGMHATYDYGIGQNISIGITGAYALETNNDVGKDFEDRIMLRARFNANIGNVLNIDPNFDLYPGIGFSNKNFGGHLGARYFFSDGFGIYSEFTIPFAYYNSDRLTPAEEIYNQFYASVGMAFNF